MRRLLAVVALGTFGVALAAQQDDGAAGRAYLGFSFGGAKAAPHDFHYGLRFDYDTRSEMRPAAPVMQFDFTRAGLSSATMNGLSVLKKSYTLKQNEAPAAAEEAPAEGDAAPTEEAPAEDPGAAPADAAAADAAPTEEGAGEAAAAEPAEQPGFFARSWNGFKNLFGMGDKSTETAAADKAAAPAPAPEPAENPGDVAQGTFMGYNAIDWATLAVGAVGIGFIASEVANGDETNQTTSTGSPPPSSGGPLSTAGVSVLPTGVTGVISTGFLDAQGGEMSREVKERIEWLDGGTGHMGDLEPAKN